MLLCSCALYRVAYEDEKICVHLMRKSMRKEVAMVEAAMFKHITYDLFEMTWE